MIGLGGDPAAGDNVPTPRVLRLTPVPAGQDLRPWSGALRSGRERLSALLDLRGTRVRWAVSV